MAFLPGIPVLNSYYWFIPNYLVFPCSSFIPSISPHRHPPLPNVWGQDMSGKVYHPNAPTPTFPAILLIPSKIIRLVKRAEPSDFSCGQDTTRRWPIAGQSFALNKSRSTPRVEMRISRLVHLREDKGDTHPSSSRETRFFESWIEFGCCKRWRLVDSYLINLTIFLTSCRWIALSFFYLERFTNFEAGIFLFLYLKLRILLLGKLLKDLIQLLIF